MVREKDSVNAMDGKVQDSGMGGNVVNCWFEWLEIPAAWLAAGITDWTVIVLAFYAASKCFWLFPLWMFVIGTRQHSLAIGGHECTHYHITKSRMLNDILASISFWPLGVGINSYRRFHFDHHRYLGTIEDPEDFHRIRLSRWQWVWPIDWKRKVLLFVMDCTFLGSIEICKAIRTIGRPKGLDVMGPILLIGSALLFLFYWPLGLLWHFSIVTTFWAVNRLRIYTEHVGAGAGLTYRMRNPSLWKRMIYLPRKTYLHWEHHRHSHVPYRRLEAFTAGG